MYIPYFFFHVKMILLLFTAPFVLVLLRDFILMILYCCRSTNRRFCWQKRCLSNRKWPSFTFYSQGNIYSLIMLFSDAARSESNFQMSEIKHAAEASTFHLETRVAILSNSSLLTQLLCCAETNNKT